MAEIFDDGKDAKVVLKVPQYLKDLYDQNVKLAKQLGVRTSLQTDFKKYFEKENKDLAAKLAAKEKEIHKTDADSLSQDNPPDSSKDDKKPETKEPTDPTPDPE